MYKEYFRLNEMPFSIAPDPRFLFMSARHREALAHLMYGLRGEGGFVLLSGEVGTGKTTICRCLLERVPANCDIAFVVNPRLSALEMLATICDELHIEYPPEAMSIKILVDRLNAHLLKANAAGRKTALIIDEAQQLDPDTLEQLRLLTNLETNTRKLLQVVLLGQPELLQLLRRPELRQVAQRVVARYHLTHLSKLEVAAYVTHRLRISGAQQTAIPYALIRPLYRYTKGIPRLINVLCDRALLGTYVEGKQAVTSKILAKAAEEVLGARSPRISKFALAAGVAGVVLTAAAGAYFWPVSKDLSPGANAASVAAKPPPAQAQGKPAPAVPVPAAASAVAAASSTQAADAAEATLALPPISSEQALSAAFRALLAEHGAVYAPPRGMAGCRYAESLGLRCFTGHGNTEVFTLYDQPMILDLRQGDTQQPVVLTRLEGDRGIFVIDGQKRTLPLQVLSGRWTGDYTLVWRPPPGFQRPLEPGMHGPAVVWLRDALATALSQPRAGGVADQFDAALAKQVDEFQTREGLRNDGVVGANTLIRLNQRLDPRLSHLLVDKEGA